MGCSVRRQADLCWLCLRFKERKDGDDERSEMKMGIKQVCEFSTLLPSLTQADHCMLQMRKRRMMKASRHSVDIGQVLVVPVEVATTVDPVLGAGVKVGALLEPSGRHIHTDYTSAGIYCAIYKCLDVLRNFYYFLPFLKKILFDLENHFI